MSEFTTMHQLIQSAAKDGVSKAYYDLGSEAWRPEETAEKWVLANARAFPEESQEVLEVAVREGYLSRDPDYSRYAPLIQALEAFAWSTGVRYAPTDMNVESLGEMLYAAVARVQGCLPLRDTEEGELLVTYLVAVYRTARRFAAGVYLEPAGSEGQGVRA